MGRKGSAGSVGEDLVVQNVRLVGGCGRLLAAGAWLRAAADEISVPWEWSARATSWLGHFTPLIAGRSTAAPTVSMVGSGGGGGDMRGSKAPPVGPIRCD